MSEWMDGYRHVDRWLRRAARLEGIIEAHKILKGDKADDDDRLLWRMAEQIIFETEEAAHERLDA